MNFLQRFDSLAFSVVHNEENKFYFREGLEGVLDELTPEVVLVYGRMPESIFDKIIFALLNKPRKN